MGLIIGGLFVLFFLGFAIVMVELPLFCIIDAATRDSAQFTRDDSNKTLWIVLPPIFGILAAIVYLVAIRPRLKEATAS